VLNRLDLRGVKDLDGRLPRPSMDDDTALGAVRDILGRVQAEGDAAVAELTQRFDGVSGPLRVASDRLATALGGVDPDVRAALEVAHGRIADFHRHQLPQPTRVESDGVVIESYARPVGRAGCYVPGGRAAYPSTLLMTAVPALVAGVGEVVVCVPASRTTGEIAPVTLAAAAIAGVDEVHAIGGAQAIAAMAYGTESIRPVDVVCGPGNRYVALAKREVAGHVGVAAAFAGPSEVVVVADETVDPAFAAVDVILQAEHGPDGLAWLVCWDDGVADAVDEAIEKLVAVAPRRDDITSTLASAGYAVVCDSRTQAIDVANRIAPEHLELMCAEPQELQGMVENAGAIFCGPWSPASIGDYVAGPSHVLPTHGSARFASALTVSDFLKHHHVVTVDRDGFERLAPSVVALAEAEGLDAHAESIRIRGRR
jgi:histidinol dehydrogenase